MTETLSEEEKQKRQEFFKILKSFDTGMLVTCVGSEKKLRARPMQVAQYDVNGDVWFVTSNLAPKVAEIRGHENVVVTFQSGSKYLSLSGSAEIIHDQTKLEDLWHDSWKTWFPKGKEDPDLSLLKVTTHEAEYWDQTWLKGTKYFFAKASALLKGQRAQEKLEQDVKVHGKVELK